MEIQLWITALKQTDGWSNRVTVEGEHNSNAISFEVDRNTAKSLYVGKNISVDIDLKLGE